MFSLLVQTKSRSLLNMAQKIPIGTELNKKIKPTEGAFINIVKHKLLQLRCQFSRLTPPKTYQI
jgi:hypothetical protein